MSCVVRWAGHRPLASKGSCSRSALRRSTVTWCTHSALPDPPIWARQTYRQSGTISAGGKPEEPNDDRPTSLPRVASCGRLEGAKEKGEAVEETRKRQTIRCRHFSSFFPPSKGPYARFLDPSPSETDQPPGLFSITPVCTQAQQRSAIHDHHIPSSSSPLTSFPPLLSLEGILWSEHPWRLRDSLLQVGIEMRKNGNGPEEESCWRCD